MTDIISIYEFVKLVIDDYLELACLPQAGNLVIGISFGDLTLN